MNEAVAQLDAVADAYVEQGKMLEAINILETIIALKPANVEEYRARWTSCADKVYAGNRNALTLPSPFGRE